MASDKCEEEEDIGSTSSDSFINDSDNDEPSTSGQDDGMHHEQVFTDEDIECLIVELLTVESKAAEAQEALEDESLTKVEVDVRDELAQSLEGEALESAVADEMLALREKWEDELDDLETESAHLLEQLDGAGIELPSLYKWIESQAPNGCCTEAWKNRTHWAGSQVTGDATESIADAEKYLQTHRPVRRHHGKLLEEGASGFLGKRLAPDVDDKETNHDVDWLSFNNLCSSSTNNTSFGSKKWASVYLASTPQQAAELGLNFPGVDEVEEIDDLEGSLDPLVANAIVTERELYQSEDHKNFRKVKEEDDVNLDRKILYRLNQKRQRRKRKLKQKGVREAEENDSSNDIAKQTSNTDHKTSSDVEMPNQESNGLCGSKRPSDSVELSHNKKDRIVNTDSSDVEHVAVDGSASPSSTSESGDATADEFHCTSCDKVANEVYTHPLLKVIVCRNCKYLLEEKMKETDPDCAECFCGWCGKSGDLLSCRSCKNLFCTLCIKKNLGEECLLKARDSGWKCCYCSPIILQSLTSQLEKAFISRSESSSSLDSDSDDSDDSDDGFKVPISKRRRKKKIRRILDDAELGEDTKRKIAIEKERQERLKSLEAERLKSLSSIKTNYANFRATVSEGATVHMLGDAQTGYIVNVVREEKEEAVRLPQSISTKLKSHQVAGIRFMWENIIQSITKVRSGDKGLGCILAHTMGLGKTLQVIAFLYAAMRSVDIGLKAAMIVTPVNVLHNWRHEFTKWRPTEFKPLRVYMLEDVPRDRRLELLMKWKAKGGIFLIGYASFRNLSLGKHVKDRHMAKEFCRTLQDGPDILVCDEAHMIKNTRADTTQALKLVKCQRRIALTGSPLQNNLMEYFCMVDFVREGFLGSSQEFRNRFQNPIENGQHTNSTSDDVKIMNQRSHILYEQLKGFVQRMDMNVVKKDLPPKTVFVIAVKLSPVQRVLYKRFLDVHGLTEEKTSNEKTRKSFFASYQALAQIWNHPGILQPMKDKGFRKRETIVENFLEESSSDDHLDYTMGNGDKLRNINELSSRKNVSGFFKEGWWDDLVMENSYEAENSGKMVLLLDILALCSDAGDKALVFSQSLPTLDLIEYHISKLPRNGKSRKCWKKGKDWYRLDGRTEGSERQKLVEKFNDPSNKRVKCTLISTRAGSLGINLYAANRVIIVDGSWNPTYDLQAIYRAWRYGQTKPVFAYRLMAHGTMEEKIYKRQVTKESLSARVVDRQQVHRTISKEEMLHLFAFGDDENLTTSKVDLVSSNVAAAQSLCEVRTSKQKIPLAHATVSSDKFMEVLLSKHHPRWIANYHEHESLLQENEDEKLSKEEQDMAWEVYHRTLEWEEVQRNPVDPSAPAPAPTHIIKPTVNGASEVKPTVQPELLIKKPPVVTRVCSRNRFVLRKCTNLAHMLTLRSQGVKPGCTTVCGECGQEINWNGISK